LGYGVTPPTLISLISTTSGTLTNGLMNKMFIEITTYDL